MSIIEQLDELETLETFEKQAGFFGPWFSRAGNTVARGFKGETLASRRAYVEATNPARAKVGSPIPAPRNPNKPLEEPIKPETDPSEADKWYKNKTLLKGVGIGAAGALGVGMAARAISNRKDQQESQSTQGYY